jgi:hypothetical protein
LILQAFGKTAFCLLTKRSAAEAQSKKAIRDFFDKLKAAVE